MKFRLERVDGGKRVTVNVNDASKLNTLALLDRLKTNMPEIWSQAQVVGKWVWLEFTSRHSRKSGPS